MRKGTEEKTKSGRTMSVFQNCSRNMTNLHSKRKGLRRLTGVSLSERYRVARVVIGAFLQQFTALNNVPEGRQFRASDVPVQARYVRGVQGGSWGSDNRTGLDR